METNRSESGEISENDSVLAYVNCNENLVKGLAELEKLTEEYAKRAKHIQMNVLNLAMMRVAPPLPNDVVPRLAKRLCQ